MYKKLLKQALLPLLILVAVPAVALAEPPPWAPAHGYRAKHRYVYYPRYDVYYAPERALWFWLDGGRWRAGAYLPGNFVVAGVPGVTVYLGTLRPYEDNAFVVEHYGRRYYRPYRYEDDEDEDD